MEFKKVEVKSNECFIPKEALSLTNFTSKDDASRPQLSGLHIINNTAEATDGFMIAQYKIKQGKDFPECVIKVSDLLRAGIDKNLNGVTISIEHTLFIIKGEYEIITHLINAKYPNLNQFVDDLKTKKTESYIALGTPVLKKLIATLEKSGHKMVALRIRERGKTGDIIKDQNIAVEFCSLIPNSISMKESGRLTGLLMPCFTKYEDCNWATGKETTESK
jgi:hypothetical protein